MSLQSVALIKTVFAGADATGGPVNISVPGVKAGDVVLSISPGAAELAPPNAASIFQEQPLTTDDQITQSSNDLSPYTLTMILARFV